MFLASGLAAAGPLQGRIGVATGLPQGYCRAVAGLLQGCCRAAAGLQQGCCRAAAGLPQGSSGECNDPGWEPDWLRNSEKLKGNGHVRKCWQFHSCAWFFWCERVICPYVFHYSSAFGQQPGSHRGLTRWHTRAPPGLSGRLGCGAGAKGRPGCGGSWLGARLAQEQ